MDKQALVGTWLLVSWETIYSDGRTICPMGKDAKGLLMYSADGYMSAALFRADRPRFTSGEMLTASDSEKCAAWNSYFSYAGAYEVSGDELIHHVAVSMYPNWVNEEQRRKVLIEGGRLVLETLPQRTRRGLQHSRVIWRKAGD